MKKLILSIIVVAAFAACKKEEPLNVRTPAGSMNQNVADIIRKADPQLYEQIYNSDPNGRAPKPSIYITHGIFNWGGGQPQDGTCLPNPNCVCHITIAWPKLIDPNFPPDSTVLTTDFHGAYTEAGEAEIIMNSSPDATTIENLKSLDIVFDQYGGSRFELTTL